MSQTDPSTVQLVAHALRPVTELSWSDDAGEHAFPLDSAITVGSGSGVDCQFAHQSVSRLHAELAPSPEGLWVRDVGSRNGVRINGVRVREGLARAGDTVAFGALNVLTRLGADSARVALWPLEQFGGLIGSSEVMRELFARMAKVADMSWPALIMGETGTGKELVARALHDTSSRARGPFLTVDCGALPEPLMESELFGHEAGAFTGAQRARIGVFEEANGGTVFLDEVGELPLAMQTRLLRVLEGGEVKRVGSSKYQRVDVRVIAATHRDLRRMVNEGSFREDLYFRLAVANLRVPSLRERRTDISLLVRHFAGARAPALTPEMLAHAETAPWPGNVRDLRNYVERSLILGHDPDSVRRPGVEASGEEGLFAIDTSQPYQMVRDRVLAGMEKAYVVKLIEEHHGNVSAAARAAGMNRTWLHELIKRHQLTPRR